MTSANRTATRTVQDEIEIAASVDAVWRALTEADELMNWFPLDARVTPGAGGEIWLSWEDLCVEWPQKIQLWEPSKHLRTTYTKPVQADPAAPPTPVEIVIDFHLEAKAGGTILRVVHSGFGADASWDQEYHGVRLGWRYELNSLRLYLEKHPGVARKVAWAKTALTTTAESGWEILMGPEGILAEGSQAGLKPGAPYAFRTATGQVFRGVVRTFSPPYEFSGTVENLGDALLRVAVEHVAADPVALVWLATYGLSQVKVDELQSTFKAMLGQLYS
jgi:uncharacterized protein YndB with AHSA1/START domain